MNIFRWESVLGMRDGWMNEKEGMDDPGWPTTDSHVDGNSFSTD